MIRKWYLLEEHNIFEKVPFAQTKMCFKKILNLVAPYFPLSFPLTKFDIALYGCIQDFIVPMVKLFGKFI